MTSSSGIKGRAAVAAGLSFGQDPQQPQGDSRAGGQKFSRALETVQEREDRRRQRQRRGQPEAAPEEEAAGGSATGGPRPVARKVVGVVDDRQKVIQQKIPVKARKPRSALVPSGLTEQVTDPRMPMPTAAQLAGDDAVAPTDEPSLELLASEEFEEVDLEDLDEPAVEAPPSEALLPDDDAWDPSELRIPGKR